MVKSLVMTTDLEMLAWIAGMTALMWIPYVVAHVLKHGMLEALTYRADAIPLEGWAERFFRKHVFDIFGDDEGIVDRPAVMHQRRHHTVGVELQIVRVEVFIVPQLDIPARIGKFLFPQAKAHLFRTGRQPAVIKLQHRSVSVLSGG